MSYQKCSVFRPPPPSSDPFCQTPGPLDDAIFRQHPSFPKMIFGKIILYRQVEKCRNQDLTMNIIQNKYQSNCC